MKFEPVDVIQANSPTGQVRPLRFRIDGRRVDVGRILSVDSIKRADGSAIIYEAESILDDCLVRYRLTYDPQKRIWYVSRL